MITRLWAVLFICLPPVAAAQVMIDGPEGDCGFSKLKPRRMADFVNHSTVEKHSPQFPPAAEARGLTGTVYVKILINKQGFVERTCPAYIKGKPRPDRTLVVAAEAAALQWTFAPNFGIEPVGGIRFDYLQDELVFEFAGHNVTEQPRRTP